MATKYTPGTFDYNSTRSKLLLTEYGRNVQNMVKYIVALPTKEELMGFLNPHLRDVADFKHKLWDHLHIISDYKIDVDAPYPLPTPEAIHIKPEPLGYPNQRIKFKHYGKTIEMMIAKAKSIEEPARRQHMVQAIANFMKMAYVQWNKDSVTDESILADLRELSNGELKLEDNINLNKVDVRTPMQNARNNNPRNNNQNNNRGGQQQNRNNSNNQNNSRGGQQNRNNNNQNRSSGGARKY
jgi:hypothetical protein